MVVTRRKEKSTSHTSNDRDARDKELDADQKDSIRSTSSIAPVLQLIVLILIVNAGVYAYTRFGKNDIVDNNENQHEQERVTIDYNDASKRPIAGTGSGSNDDLSHVIATGGHLFSLSELQEYNGEDLRKKIYLAVLGQVFDVSKGTEHYGKNGGYNFFTGRDGTRAFVTGDFTEKGLVDDIKGLSYEDLIGIKEWVDFYHADYSYAGKLVGRYYDSEGVATTLLHKIKKRLKKAFKLRKEAEIENLKLPGCNSRWSQEEGTVYWCETRSGGIERKWVGVPRHLLDKHGKSKRCACVRTTGSPSYGSGTGNRGDLDNPFVKEYAGCDPTATTCRANDV